MRVGLFVTCLVSLFRPRIGLAAARLLRAQGHEVYAPRFQTCCGQPAYNAGDYEGARRFARALLALFVDVDALVVPSGSCAAMILRHYPRLFMPESLPPENSPPENLPVKRSRHALLRRGEEDRRRADSLSERCSELTCFLAQHGGIEARPWPEMVTYHDSCSGVNELGIRQAPRRLLLQVPKLDLRPLPESEICCGFGGTFCVKFPEISGTILRRKIKNIVASDATTVVAGDLGCLLNISGGLTRARVACRGRHVAEVLASDAKTAPIGGRI